MMGTYCYHLNYLSGKRKSLCFAFALIVVLFILLPRVLKAGIVSFVYLSYSHEFMFSDTMPSEYPIYFKAELNEVQRGNIRLLLDHTRFGGNADDFSIRWSLGRIALASGEYDTAMQLLEPIEAHAKMNPLLYLDMLVTYSYAGFPDRVLALYEQNKNAFEFPQTVGQVVNETVALAYLDLSTVVPEQETITYFYLANDYRPGDLDEKTQMIVLTSGKLRQPIPQHPHIVHRPIIPVSDILRPRRVWLSLHEFTRRHLISRTVTNMGDDAIWLSTYYTMPPIGWKGKTVAFVYDMIHEKYADLFNKRTDALFREQKQQVVESADRVICISETTRQDVLDLYQLNPEHVGVAHLAHSPIFRPLTDEMKSPFSQPYILYVGSRAHYKIFRFLLEGYANWPNRQIELVVVGSPWTDPENELLQKYDLVDRVHLLSGVSDEELTTLYNVAEAFVYPSLYEGFGIPLLEAMACGCPVVASDIPSSCEVAADAAFYFDPTSIESLHTVLDRNY
jgi:glycosyltransferase involved in cell wall biosynthesis